MSNILQFLQKVELFRIFFKYSILRKYTYVKQLDVRQRFNCYIVSENATDSWQKCIILLVLPIKCFQTMW